MDPYTTELSKSFEQSLTGVKPTSVPTSFTVIPVKSVSGALSTQKRESHTIILELLVIFCVHVQERGEKNYQNRTHYSLVNCVYISNKSASSCTIKIAETNKASDYTVVVENQLLPHNKTTRIPLGTLPCKFVKVIFEKGTPISVKKVEVYGCRIEQAESCMGLGYASAILQNPHGIIY